MDLRKYSNAELTNFAINIEDSLISSNHDISHTSFALLIQNRGHLVSEVQRRGLDYKTLLRSI